MTESAAHDLFETFVAQLASVSASAQLRERIEEAFLRWTDCRAVVFVERTPDNQYLYYGPSLAARKSVDPTGPFVRWLRVNNELVVFRERHDVWSYLSEEDRDFIESAAGEACVPLVNDGTLVAFLILCGVGDVATLARRRPLLEAYALRAADQWDAVRRAEDDQARREAMGHSHRLGIAGQVAASIAHEVRNPLAAIRSLVQFTRDVDLDTAERASILDDVLEEVDRIDQTVMGMLELSQPPSRERRAVDLKELLRGTTRFVRAYAARRGVTVSAPSPDAPTVYTLGDARELRQMVTNLLLNGCQASPAGAIVSTDLSREVDGQVRWGRIDVRDTGGGIAPEHLTRVFEPFFTTKPQGTGLGLPFCRDVVARHGGTITIASVPGAGTTIAVHLPMLEPDESHLGR